MLAPTVASAGVYKSMEDYVHADNLEPFAITHSPGYNGAGGLIQMRICVEDTPASRPLVGPLQAALKMWNALVPTTGNCGGTDICHVWEDTTFLAGSTDVMSTLLHEIGHCGMGLGHPTLGEWRDPPNAGHTGICDVDNDGCCGERTSFTNSVDAEDAVVIFGGLRGDRLNQQTNGCPTSGGAPPPIAPKGTCAPPAFACPVPAQCCPNPPPPAPFGGTVPVRAESLAHVQWSYDQTGEPFVFHWTQIPVPGHTFMEVDLNTTPVSSTWDFGSLLFSSENEAGDLREWDGVSP